jgi:Raf kinase inhibitor-like YbhB/YbcL family protein
VQGYANGGKPGYEGPCPPSGTHRYVFTLYALEEVLDVPSSATRDTLLPYIEKYELSEATLTGIYTLSKNAS